MGLLFQVRQAQVAGGGKHRDDGEAGLGGVRGSAVLAPQARHSGGRVLI